MEKNINNKTHNLQLTLPKQLYQKLQSEAQRMDKPATSVAQIAIEAWLLQKENENIIKQQISEFIELNAGTELDIDPDWEAAGLQTLNELDEYNE
jgi:hypothetical protein